MAKYEVILRQYDEDGNLAEERNLGAEDGMYDGVCVMGHRAAKDLPDDTVIGELSRVDVACMIATESELLQSAIIAEAMERGRKIDAERKTGARLSMLLGGKD